MILRADSALQMALNGRSGSSNHVGQLLICLCPGDAFLFE
jgi:hypothetical protein